MAKHQYQHQTVPSWAQRQRWKDNIGKTISIKWRIRGTDASLEDHDFTPAMYIMNLNLHTYEQRDFFTLPWPLIQLFKEMQQI